MRNDDPPRMEVELLLDPARKIPALFGGKIFRIAENGMADMGGMGAQLMGAAGNRTHGQPGELVSRLLDDRVERNGVARLIGAVARDTHAVALGPGLLGEPGRDPPLLRL